MDSQVVWAAIVIAAIVAGIAGKVLLRASRSSAVPVQPRPVTEGTIVRARALIGQGKQILAIKGIREETGLGLKEAKDLADALRDGRPLPVQVAGPGTVAPVGADLAARARALRSQGRQVDAIRLVVTETGMSETEATRFLTSLDGA
ncbi:50S ribosomal protein L7/L12 [Nocardiopsis sediminis]|uniref:50S ribosomal protein L7/L12 n=1 Tax=Nocardiopsis sediminis TaxID=1778267 RepID=A0ABV8FI84_9ACTN